MWFLIDHVSNNDENAVKVTEGKMTGTIHNLLRVQSEKYTTLQSALIGCGIHSID